MTTEDDFQNRLDAEPYDWQTKLVFADWLQERDDPRAEGYRVMGTYGMSPVFSGYKSTHTASCPFWQRCAREDGIRWIREVQMMPPPWFDALDVPGTVPPCAPVWSLNCKSTRRFLEDEAARAFRRLTGTRRSRTLTWLRRREKQR